MESKERRREQVDRLTVGIEGASRMIGCHKDLVEALVNQGYIKLLKLGAKKIPKFEIMEFMHISTEQDIDWNAVIAGELVVDWENAKRTYRQQYGQMVSQFPPQQAQPSVYHAFPTKEAIS